MGTNAIEEHKQILKVDTPVHLPGKSHGRRSLVGYSPWVHKESDTRLSNFTFTFTYNYITSISSVIQLCLTLCDPMDCSIPGLPIHRQLLEFTHSCPLSRWCHPTISSFVVPFSSRLQSFPATGSFQMSQFFASGGQSIGGSASASVLPVNS